MVVGSRGECADLLAGPIEPDQATVRARAPEGDHAARSCRQGASGALRGVRVDVLRDRRGHSADLQAFRIVRLCDQQSFAEGQHVRAGDRDAGYRGKCPSCFCRPQGPLIHSRLGRIVALRQKQEAAPIRQKHGPRVPVLLPRSIEGRRGYRHAASLGHAIEWLSEGRRTRSHPRGSRCRCLHRKRPRRCPAAARRPRRFASACCGRRTQSSVRRVTRTDDARRRFRRSPGSRRHRIDAATAGCCHRQRARRRPGGCRRARRPFPPCRAETSCPRVDRLKS